MQPKYQSTDKNTINSITRIKELLACLNNETSINYLLVQRSTSTHYIMNTDKLNSGFKAIKKGLFNATVSAVKTTCGTTHLALRYGIDATEYIETRAIHKLTGESHEDIRNDRRRHTNATRLKHQKIANDIFAKVADAKKEGTKRTMTLIHEFQTFNKVTQDV